MDIDSFSWFRLAIANVGRALTGNLLALVALMSGTVLFVLLQSISSAYSHGLKRDPLLSISLQRLHNVSLVPKSQFHRIGDVAGVAAFTPVYNLAVYFQEPSQRILIGAVAPRDYLDVFNLALEDPARSCFVENPLGMIATADIAARFGMQPGRRIPFVAMHMRTSNDLNWSFEFCGTFDVPEGGTHAALARFDHVTRADMFPGQGAAGFVVRVKEAFDPLDVARRVDALFELETYATETVPHNQAERQAQASFVDWAHVTTFVVAASLFAVLLLTACVTSHALRERTPDFALLDALGFTKPAIVGLVLMETCSVTVAGASLGAMSALALEPVLLEMLRGLVGRFEVDAYTAVLGVAAGGAIGVLAATGPIVRTLRLSTAETLRR